ncbi:hypothetical protein [Mycoplasmopsis felifaucium]|uniref:hypothetical protein n=1 Tax=Mycoplasmopsis felifaucium TaxID=35768 RepID=UPI000488B644|nr:hypothetical protein [Mycoplasmopsis felifaucium]
MVLLSSIKNDFYTLKASEKPKTKRKLPALGRWFLNISRLVLSIGASFISEAVNVVAPGVGMLVDWGLNTLIDAIANLIENYGDFQADEFLISAGMNLIPFVLKGLRRVSNFVKGNKVLGFADNLKLSNKSLADTVKQQANKLNYYGVNNIVNNIDDTITNYSANNLAFKKINDNFKQMNKTLLEANKFIGNKNILQQSQNLAKASKIMHNVRVASTLILSPRYAARKLVQKLTDKPWKAVSNTWNNWIDSKVKNITKRVIKGTAKTVEEAQKNIALNSHWLYSLKIYKAYNPWNTSVVNALLTFRPETTNNKKPVLLVQKSYSHIMNLIQSPSAGKYYLKNFAWGWEVGKFLRNFGQYSLKSKMPLFTRFISNFNYTFKSLEYIVKSIKNVNKNKWNNLGNELVEGFKEGMLKKPNFKFIDPLVQSFKSSITGNSYYAIKKGLDIGHKTAWRNKIAGTLDNSYVSSYQGQKIKIKTLKQRRAKGVK